MKKLQYKFTNLKKAYARLIEVSSLSDGNNDIIRDSLIQRFEFTYELKHKTQQDFFNYSDITLEVTFPQMIYKKSYSNNLIDDEQLWIRLLEDKNATWHLYSEDAANDIANRIVSDYVDAIDCLIQKLNNLTEIEK